MARGWESKAVEQQQEMAASNATERKAALTAKQIAGQKQREGLQLSRQQVLQQLQSACNPRHRQMLEAALADLDAQIGAIAAEHDKIEL
jgi:hypothetical protein